MNTEAELWVARMYVTRLEARLEAKLKAEAEKDAIPVGTLVWAWWHGVKRHGFKRHDAKRLAFAAGDKQVSFEPGGRSWKCERVERVDLKSLGLPQTSSKSELTKAYNAGFANMTYRAESFIEENFPEAT